MFLTKLSRQPITFLKRPLKEVDPFVYEAICHERDRQLTGINLIASQNYCSNACFAAVGSVLNNKYSEGYPNARYYGGTRFIDDIEIECRKRALETFKLSPQKWGVNVQALSGSPANFAVFTGLLNPFDRIMSLDLPHGGHLSHGFQTMGKKISATSKYYQVLPYFLDQKTAQIDYENLHKNALIYRPKLIIAGTSAYSQLIDYKKMRDICDDVDAILHSDMAHPAGLIAAGLIPSPFEYSDVVTTTTHKTLRGPRGSLIFYRVGDHKDKKGQILNLKQKIDTAVFPGLQGGPHNHAIAGIAVALKQAQTQEFKNYQVQVLKNINHLCKKLKGSNYQIVSGGTKNHLILVDMRSKDVDGARMELILNDVDIYINKNTVPGDKSALLPSAIRIGSCAMTTRGLVQSDFDKIFEFIERAVKICHDLKGKSKDNKLKTFKQILGQNKQSGQISKLRKDVNQFASKFPTPGGLL